MAILESEYLSVALENNVRIVIHSQLEKVRSELERQFHDTSLSEDSIHDLREIQCLVNDAEQINENRALPLPEKIDSVQDKIDLAIQKVRSFHQKHKEPLPEKVFDDLTEILNALKQKINSARQKLEQIQTALGKILGQQTDLRQIRTKHEFKYWSEAMEEFIPPLEAYLNEFPDMPIGLIEDLATELIAATAQETDGITQKEKYRRRLRYAGTFLLDLARKKRRQSAEERNIEERVVERIKNIDETELISLSEPGRPINIDKINERLKQRGYRVQLPCKDLTCGQS